MGEELKLGDMFEEFYDFVRNNTIEEVIKTYGGASIYIPSYKLMYRDRDLIADWEAGMDIREMVRKYNLSSSRIWSIIKEHKKNNPKQPSLFEKDDEA